MKPKTKLQLEVVRMSKELPDEDDKMLSWAKSNVLQHKGYETKNRIICFDCGERFSPNIVIRKRATCPHCGAKLSIEKSRRTTLEQVEFVAFAQVIFDYQVVRYFEIRSHHKSGFQAKYYSCEILQHWIRKDGKRETVARNHTLNYSVDSWNGDMEIRKDYNRWYRSANKYDIYTEHFHPDSKILYKYTMYGIDHNLAGLTFIEAIKIVPSEPRLETMLKAKQYWLLANLSQESYSLSRLWPSIKICIRNRYIVKDAKIWSDYIELLRFFQKDIHNAKYVCPKNLKKEHDRFVAKKRTVQERIKIEEKRSRIEIWEKEFKEKKAHLLGICFESENIKIKTLDSVQEYLEEGDTLHHCVFTNEYFLKQDSICLSARIDEKPIETIELSLSEMKIVQCRGSYNSVTPHHDNIVNLLNNNINVIKSLQRGRERQDSSYVI
ncbi:MAG: PcfJ domain-containing protein [Bacteroidales bacterium]|nr:PcfJ domain-containing protein [Bacteroidales bacterium]